MRDWRLLPTAIAVFCLVSCVPVAAPQSAEERDLAMRSAHCLRIDQIDNWRVIDSRQLIVYGPRRNDAWHVRLFGACIHLQSAEVLAFRARGTNRLCGAPGDEILLRGDRCSIRSMTPVSPLEAAALLSPGVGNDIGKLPPATPKEKTEP